MSDRTKQLLIIVAGIVVLAVVFRNPIQRWIGSGVNTWKCPDGTRVRLIDPEEYFLKYTGTRAGFTVEWQQKAKATANLSDEAIQQALQPTQILDMRLRQLVQAANRSACDPRGREELQELERYRGDEFERLTRVLGEWHDAVEKGDASRAKALAAAIPGQARDAASAVPAARRRAGDVDADGGH